MPEQMQGATVDGELRQAFATISEQIAGVGRDAREAVNLGKDALATAQRAERQAHEASEQAQKVARHVFGSTPPTEALNGSKSLVSRESQTNETRQEEHDTLAGHVLALAGQVATVQAELVKQSKAMGVGSARWSFIWSRAGLSALIRILTLLAALAGVAHEVIK